MAHTISIDIFSRIQKNMDYTLISIGISFLLAYFTYSIYRRYWGEKGIPGPRGFPLVGSALQIKLGRIHHQFYDMAQTYGKIFEVEIFNTKMVVLNDVEIIHKAFATDGQFFNDRPLNFAAKHLGYIEGITLRNLDKKHRLSRKAFVKSLQLYGTGSPRFENVVQSEISRLLKTIQSHEGKEFEVTEMMRRSVVNVMSVLAASTSDERKGIIQELLHFRKNGDEEDNLSDETIKSIALLDVFSAGVLTTSSVLPSIILCLVNYPENQKRLQKELDSVIGRDRPVSISDRQACPFLEAIFMETTRLLLPGAFWVPHICRQDRNLEGYLIKAHTQVFANAWFIHHDEKIWGDPWSFRPERFLDDNGKILPNDHKMIKSWVPFGLGLRKCPGMGMATSRVFLYIASLFQKYSLLPVAGKFRSCDPRSDDFVFQLLLRPKPFFCRAIDREKSD